MQRNALAAELEDDALQRGCRLRCDGPSDGRGPGEGNDVNVSIHRELHRAFAAPLDHDVQHSPRQAGFLCRLAEDRRLKGRQWTRSEHYGAAGQQRRNHFPHVGDEGEVVRRDGRDDAHCLVTPDRQPDRSTHEMLAQRDLVVLPFRQSCVEIGQLPDARQRHADLSEFGDRSGATGLCDDRLDEQLASRLEGICQPPDRTHPFLASEPWPGPLVEGVPGGGDRAAHLLDGGALDRRNDVSRGR